MFGNLLLITFIRQFFKLLNNIWKVLLPDISDGTPFLFVFVWPYFGLETNRGDQTLSWSFQFFFWIWICHFHLVQTVKFQWYFQGDILVTNLDLPVFPNITTTTNFHVHIQEQLFLTCQFFLQERLPSGDYSLMTRSEERREGVMGYSHNSGHYIEQKLCITRLDWVEESTQSVWNVCITLETVCSRRK